MTPHQLAARLDEAAAALSAVDRAVPGLAAPAGAFGADDAGVPGRVGQALHDRWRAVLAARSHEAADAAARLTDMAAAVRVTQQHYADVDDQAARRIRGASE
jgi:hypothetical protein